MSNELIRLRKCFQPRQWFVGDGEFDPFISEEDTFMWVFLKNKDGVYEVGFYTPDGSWNPTDKYETNEEAAMRVNYLNGGKR